MICNDCWGKVWLTLSLSLIWITSSYINEKEKMLQFFYEIPCILLVVFIQYQFWVLQSMNVKTKILWLWMKLIHKVICDFLIISMYLVFGLQNIIYTWKVVKIINLTWLSTSPNVETNINETLGLIFTSLNEFMSLFPTSCTTNSSCSITMICFA